MSSHRKDATADERRSFRNRLWLLLLVFVCVPAAVYVDMIDLRHKPHENLLGFLLLFLFIFMVTGYGSLQFTRFVARRRFGDSEIAEQKAQDEKIQKQLEPRKREFEREYFGNNVFAWLMVLLVPLFGILGGAVGVGLDNPPRYFKLGALIGIALAYFISNAITKRKFKNK